MKKPMRLDDQTIARRLEAAAIAVRHDGTLANREILIELCAYVQASLAPPPEALTWRSHDGRVHRLHEMSADHLMNALWVLIRRPDEGMSPMFPALLAEARRRLDSPETFRPDRRRIRKSYYDVESSGLMLGWLTP